MLGNKLEQAIIGIFQDDLSKVLSINEIARRLHKAYPYVHKKTSFFISENILKKTHIGNSFQCSLNLHEEKTRLFMKINEINKRDASIKKDDTLLRIKKEIEGDIAAIPGLRVDTVIMHGNDIFYVLEDMEHSSIIQQKNKLEKHNLIFFNKETFLQYFLNNSHLMKNHVILYGIDSYLEITSELEEKLFIKGLTRK
jgi:hypothetical protein